MSPTKRPSTVDGLRRGVGTVQAGPVVSENPLASPTATAAPGRPPKPVRVTLHLTPADYAALKRWTESAVVTVNPDFPKLSLARALRAMIHATISDQAVNGAVVDQLRQEQA